MNKPLTQHEFETLLVLEKHYIGTNVFRFPTLGGTLRVPLYSEDRREEFSLDITRSHILLAKQTFQTRARKTVVLARLDIGGAPHCNPDGVEIACPHMHLYREGFGDKWAITLPEEFTGINDTLEYMEKFMRYCAITTPPIIKRELFI